MDQALKAIHQAGRKSPYLNVVAFSGGVDSSVVAALVKKEYPDNSIACIGISSSLPKQQLLLARSIATHISIPLYEMRTKEGIVPGYIDNDGKSCWYCKTTLYSTLKEVYSKSCFINKALKFSRVPSEVTLFNGTNSDDLLDPTRLGIQAAEAFKVASPLKHLSKDGVRQIAKSIGLPNWNTAASPCLRSRLQFGVKATFEHLRQVEEAEIFVRETLKLSANQNLRVRFLSGSRAAVELDADMIDKASRFHSAIDMKLKKIGFNSSIIRKFRTGSLSGFAVPKINVH